MADADKNVKITPNTSQTAQPNVVYTGQGNVPITMKILDDSYGTLSFEGSAGQLFSVNNNLTSGVIYSVNDVSGIPQFDVNADGTVRLVPFGTALYLGGVSGNSVTVQPATRTSSGAGANLTLTAGSGVTSGAGGSLILQAGVQATTGGDGKVAVKQVAGQTSNLQEWQNSSGSALASLDTTGRMTVPYLNAIGGTYSASSPALVLSTGTGFYYSNPYLYFCAGNNSSIQMNPAGGQLIVNVNGQPGSTSGQVLVRPGNGGGAQVNCIVVQSNPNQGSYLMYTVTGHGAMTIAPDVPSVSCVTLNGSAAYTLTATNKSLTANVATITVSGGTPRIDVGDTVVVALSPADAVFDGTYTISAKSGNNLSYARTNTNVPSTATAGTVSSTATTTLQNINIGVPGAKGLVIKAAASQTANLQEWQNSSGTALAAVDSAGALVLATTNNVGSNLRFVSTSSIIGWYTGDYFGINNSELVLGTTASFSNNSLAVRNSTTPQNFRVYNTFTNSTNYERLGISWASDICTIGLQQAGTGLVRSLVIAGANATSGAGGNVTITAGNGSGVGAGGNIILQPGAQGSSGGNGVTVWRNSAGVEKARCLESGQFISSTAGVGYGWAPAGATSITHGLRCNNPGQGYITIQGQGNNFLSVDSNNGQTNVAAPASSANWRFQLVNSTNAETLNGAWALSCSTSDGVALVRNGASAVAGGGLAFPSSTTAFSANTNDLALTGSGFQRINCTSAASLTGIAPPSGGTHVDGRMVRVYNVGTANLTLAHNSASSTAANRMFNSTGADIILAPNDYAELIWDGTNNGSGAAGWRVS